MITYYAYLWLIEHAAQDRYINYNERLHKHCAQAIKHENNNYYLSLPLITCLVHTFKSN